MKSMQIVNFSLLVVLLVFCGWMATRIPPKAKPAASRIPCSVRAAADYRAFLGQIAEQEEWKALHAGGRIGERALWLAEKAKYALHRTRDPKALDDPNMRNFLEDAYVLLLRARSQNDQGAEKLQEEGGGRLRAYRSPVDNTVQTYSVSVPGGYDPAIRWPLIVSMHGHGWYGPFQGHPAPSYGGAICLAPQGRGATDYKDLGEDDVLAAIQCVKGEFNVDDDRVYLTGSSMGGTGAYHLGVHYADQFAAIFPIVGNADNRAWTERWGWNRRFEGRNDDLREFVQEGHTARAFAENLRNLPVYILTGGADGVVPPAHSRNVVAELRRLGIQVEFREYPGAGHGGFPASATADGLAWMCSWTRDRFPRHVTWKADLLKHGRAYWVRMEQLEVPMHSGCIDVMVMSNHEVNVMTENLLAFSMQKPTALFDGEQSLVVRIDNDTVEIPKGKGADEDGWIGFRRHPGTGHWMGEDEIEVQPLIKRKGCEGPVHEAFMNPFALVVGTQNPDMNDVWLREARQFAEDWKYKNAGYPRIVYDVEVTEQMEMDYNLILFGGSGDNAVSTKIVPQTPVRSMYSLLHFQSPGILQQLAERGDVGNIFVYPNVVNSAERLVVVIHANGPEAAYQLWGRFGNWFNWGVFDSKKYFDFAIFDGRSCSPETMLLVGWFGTDWSIRNSVYFLGNEKLRAESAVQHYPAVSEIAEDAPERLELYDVMPAKVSQMRGAIGLGRTFFGEPLDKSIGMRAPCVVEYDINGKYAAFSTDVKLLNPRESAMCKQRKDGEAIKFAVYGDDKLLGEPVVVNWRMPEGTLAVDVTGVKRLRLEATPAGGPAWLHMGSAWIAPVLERQPAEK